MEAKKGTLKDLTSIYNGKEFKNYHDFNMMGDLSIWKAFRDMLFVKNQREPAEKLKSIPVDPTSLFTGRKKSLRATWLGHSSFIMEIDGLRMLLDPVLSNNVSPLPWLYSVGRFQVAPPVSTGDLPEIDVAIISHNHYDHLDKWTIGKIHEKINHFVVPLKVESYLKKWGVKEEKISVLDWSDSVKIKGVEITALPSQHFSARGIFDRNKTLWASWKVAGKYHKFFFSGDSGYHELFKVIGKKHGPFDLVILDSGQFNKGWPYVHMFPHEAAQAFLDLKGKAYLPVHWGSFNLSLHNWYDPIELAVRECESRKINYAIANPGETIDISKKLPRKKWWEDYR